MQMIPVRSSAIQSIGYDHATRRMKIRFHQGHAYDFSQVPEYVFLAFLAAPSKGDYYNTHIRDRYQCP